MSDKTLRQAHQIDQKIRVHDHFLVCRHLFRPQLHGQTVSTHISFSTGTILENSLKDFAGGFVLNGKA
jgi:CHASE1-domain containing sensor protein